MTKIYKATPPRKPESRGPGGKPYAISPEAEGILRERPPEAPPDHGNGTIGGSKYLTDAGSEFTFELNVLDTASKKPIRGVEIKIGDNKSFTDRVGRAVFRLPFGSNSVFVNGAGFIEAGEFAPRATQFEPMVLELDVDSDSIYTIYSSGQVVPGERHEPGNPHGSSFDIETFIRENWKSLGLVGGGVTATYLLTKKRGK